MKLINNSVKKERLKENLRIKVSKLKKVKKFKKVKKGQMFTAELMISMVVFIGIILIITALWDYSVNKANAVNFEDEMHVRQVADLLVSTQGMPANWSANVVVNKSYVTSLGLIKNCVGINTDCMTASYPSSNFGGKNVIDAAKLSKLNQSYEGASELLGLQGFDFKADLFVFNGTLYFPNSSIFANQTYNDSNSVYVVRREVVVDNKPARFIFYAWKR